MWGAPLKQIRRAKAQKARRRWRHLDSRLYVSAAGQRCHLQVVIISALIKMAKSIGEAMRLPSKEHGNLYTYSDTFDAIEVCADFCFLCETESHEQRTEP